MKEGPVLEESDDLHRKSQSPLGKSVIGQCFSSLATEGPAPDSYGIGKKLRSRNFEWRWSHGSRYSNNQWTGCISDRYRA
jgi:hypothetical protein